MAVGEVPSLDSLVTIVQTAGPSGILAFWLYTEVKERKRLQAVVESFIPMVGRTQRLVRNVNKVLGGADVNGDSDEL